MKILFVLRKSQKVSVYSQGSFGLSNSAQFVVNKLKSLGHDVKAVQVVDANCIDREVTAFQPQTVIIEALWVPPTKLAELLRLHLRRKWIVRIHSKAAFLAMEGIALEWMTGYNHVNDIYNNVVISCNNKQFNDDINGTIGLDSVYLPNIYFPHYPSFHSCFDIEDDGERAVNVGCFGAIRPLKNQFQQAIAAILFGNKIKRKVNFHVNGTRAEQLGNNVVRNIRELFNSSPHTLVEHDWYSHEEFVTKLIPTMDVGLQVSFTESFNIVTADFVHAGIPIVVSHDVDWMPRFNRVDPNNTDEIIRKLCLFYKYPSFMHRSSQAALADYNRTATQIWQEELNR